MYERKAPESDYYVNNKEFSNAVIEYVRRAKDAEECGEPAPMVTDYIAECFLRIANRLSYKSNFINYTYREEMVMDAVENCLKVIRNYDIEAATRSGTPNAFAYFTQITWYAFIRRINKEKRQQEIKMRYLAKTDLDTFMGEQVNKDEDPELHAALTAHIDGLRQKMAEYSEETVDTQKKSPKKKQTNSGLDNFL
jgi:hypothetical protein